MIPEGTTEVFECSSSSSNPASTVTWIMLTGDDEQDLTGKAVQVTTGGLNKGWNVSSRLNITMSRDLNGFNLTCYLIFENNVVHSYTYSIEVACK